MSTIIPWPPMARAMLNLLERDHPDLDPGDAAHAGGKLPSAVADYYVFVGPVGQISDILEGDFTFDIEAFSPSYATAESLASSLEALVFGYPHVVGVGDRTVVFDKVVQNTGPEERPWADDSVTRFGATYTITARRR